MSQRIEGNRALISTAQACERTGFTSAYIQRLLREERIEGVKLGRDWLVYEDSVEAFITEPRKRGRPHKEAPHDGLDTPSTHDAEKQEAQAT